MKEKNIILEAAGYAKLFHHGQKRKHTGEDYIVHPMRVAGRVCLIPTADEDVVAAAWLHDVLEDCSIQDRPVMPEDLLRIGFPQTVVKYVEELTNPSKGSVLSRTERKRMDRNHLAQVSYWAKVIKLCDRIDNVTDLRHDLTPNDFKVKYADESLLLQNVLYTADPVIDQLCRELRMAILKLAQ